MPPIPIVERDVFQKAFEESEGQTVLPVYKYFTPTVKMPEKEGGDLTFVISNPGVDRDNDTIAMDGWNLKNYKKNPVVMWGHDYSLPPIGRSKRLSVKGEDLISVPEFVPKEIFPFAGMVKELVHGGWVKAASVGFVGETVAWNEKRGGFDFQKQELLEYSIVPIPSNPDALAEAKGAGVDLSPMVKWAEGIVLKNKQLVESQDLFEWTWMQYLAKAVKDLNKKTVSVDIDLMEVKGTIFEEVVAPTPITKGCTDEDHEDESDEEIVDPPQPKADDVEADEKAPAEDHPKEADEEVVFELEPSEPALEIELELQKEDEEKSVELSKAQLDTAVQEMVGAFKMNLSTMVEAQVQKTLAAHVGRLD